MTNKKLVKSLYKTANCLYNNEPSGHNFLHIKKVLNFAKKISKREGGNWFIIYVSVLYHDIHRIEQTRTGKYLTPKQSMPKVKEILEKFEISKNDLNQIYFAIENHEDKLLKIEKTLELKILQDADVLDTLGKRGLTRCLTYCKKHNIPVVNEDYSLDCAEYIPDVNPISACHYIFRTILKNEKNLNTCTGKKLAQKQTQVLKDYIYNMLKIKV